VQENNYCFFLHTERSLKPNCVHKEFEFLHNLPSIFSWKRQIAKYNNKLFQDGAE